MDIKLYCPHCGRCLGQCYSTYENTNCKVLINAPKTTKRHFIHNMKCKKCKNEIFILMEFIE